MNHHQNKNPSSFGLRASCQSESGAALVIVLAFMVLLVGVVVAFFVKATNDRQVSDSSASQTKVELMARGALDTIVDDLRQEITDGSTATTVVTGSVTNVIYTPCVNSNAVPSLVGSTGTGGLQNLVKISTNAPFYSLLGTGGTSITGVTRASAISTTNSSLNFRSISPTRWNKPLFLPPNSATDYTPPATFPTPTWVYVNRAGSNPSTWSDSMRYSATNSSAVIGRYAYAIYDEGGLLNMNVAGFPSTLANSPTPYATNQLNYRGSTAYADLTQLTNASGQLLTQAQIDQIVSWRNAATLQDSNIPPAASTTTNYVNLVSSSSKGFLTTANTSLLNGNSDRVFGSRQQLISYFQKQLGGGTGPINALQYLSTFSRSLNQPSIDPSADTNYVKWGTGDPPLYTNYPGGNNAYTYDTNINVIFLTNRIAAETPWTRNDGTPAITGDPLVKKRFPLDRLAWITAKGPICDGSYPGIASTPAQVNADTWIQQNIIKPLHDTYGLSYAFLQKGTAANIRNYFGLVWSGGVTPSWAGLLAPNFWFYAPGAYGSSLASTPTAGSIARLQDITGREPNFIELLKSAIHVGGLAKSVGNSGSTYAYTAGAQAVRQYISFKDSSTDMQVIQLAANIIEQSTLDAYPRRIVFDIGQGTGPRLYVGVDDLPYFYRFQTIALCVNRPNPMGATGYNPTNNPFGTYNNQLGTITTPGAISMLIIPEIWNPHDMNCRSNAVTRPNSLRLVADNTDPLTATMGDTTGMANSTKTLGINGSSAPIPVPAATKFVLSPTNSELDFNDLGGTLFREPTALRNPNTPAGSGLITGLSHLIRTDTNTYLASSGTSGYLSDYRLTSIGISPSQPNNQFLGIYLGSVPIGITTNISGLNYVTNAYTYNLYHNEPQLTFRIQYKDLYGNWVDYDIKGWGRIGGGQSPSYGAAQLSAGNVMYDIGGAYSSGSSKAFGDVSDPRTSRWGIRAHYPLNNSVPHDRGPASAAWIPSAATWTQSNNVLGTLRPSFSNLNRAIEKLNNPDAATDQANWTSIPNTGGNPNPVSGADDGFLSINSTNYGKNSISSYLDPDGVTRWGMSFYTPFTGSTPSSDMGLPLSTATSGWDTSTPSATIQSQSRPMILHRPFATVAELGCVFSDSIWKNIDFFTPQSPYTKLLDLFCIHDSPPDQVMEAGKINLNTRQAPVLQSILNGAYRDALHVSTTAVPLTSTDAAAIANKLVARTTNNATGYGPLINVGDLVGSFSSSAGAYTGFSSDLPGVIGASGTANGVIQRYLEAAVRPLSDCGQTRVWNLMIDLVAQTGRFPASANSLSNFVVEGEQRYWLHVAIDRATGQVIDSQIELVKE